MYIQLKYDQLFIYIYKAKESIKIVQRIYIFSRVTVIIFWSDIVLIVFRTLWTFVESFIICYYRPSGLFCKMWFKCEKGIFSIVRKSMLGTPYIPHSVLSTHTHSTLTSAGASAYFITTFVQKILALNQMSNHVIFFFFAPLCHFLWAGKCWDISVPSVEGDFPSHHALIRRPKFSHYHCPVLLPNAVVCQCVHRTFFSTAWHRSWWSN